MVKIIYDTYSPVHSALALIAQQPQALQEALPEVLEQRSIDGLQSIPGCSVHRHIQLCHRLQRPAITNVHASLYVLSVQTPLLKSCTLKHVTDVCSLTGMGIKMACFSPDAVWELCIGHEESGDAAAVQLLYERIDLRVHDWLAHKRQCAMPRLSQDTGAVSIL